MVRAGGVSGLSPAAPRSPTNTAAIFQQAIGSAGYRTTSIRQIRRFETRHLQSTANEGLLRVVLFEVNEYGLQNLRNADGRLV